MLPKKTILGLFLTGILLLTTGSYLKYNQNVLAFQNQPQQIENLNSVPKPQSIIFPSLSMTINITQSQIKNGIWQISPDKANHLNTSASPTQSGSIIIYAHNSQNLFANLKHLKVDQSIKIVTEDKTVHSYKIFEIQTVSPDNLNILNSNQETLIVYTCTGLFDTKRLVIKAQPDF